MKKRQEPLWIFTVCVLIASCSYRNSASVTNSEKMLNLNNQCEDVANRVHCPRMSVNSTQRYLNGLKILAIWSVETEFFGCSNKNRIVAKNDANSAWITDLIINNTVTDKSINMENIYLGKTIQDLLSALVKKSVTHAMVSSNKHDKGSYPKLMYSYIPRTKTTINETLFFATTNLNTTFIYGFIHEKEFYILLTEPSNGYQIQTKLIHWYFNEFGFISRLDHVITCDDQYSKKSYTYGTSAQFTKEGSLFVAFSENENTGSNELRTILCSFSIQKTNQTFQQLQQKISDCKFKQGKYEECKRILGEPRASITERVTSWAVTIQGGRVTAFFTTCHKNLLQFTLDTGKFCSEPVVNVSFVKNTTAYNQEVLINRSNPFDKENKKLNLIVSGKLVTHSVDYCSRHDYFSSCLSSELNCAWCDDECSMKKNCPRKSNKNAHLILEEPLSGPTRGGTILKLSGQFGGNFITEVKEQVQFTINNKACTVRNWTKPSNSKYKWSVECETPEMIADGTQLHTGPISLIIKDIFSGPNQQTVKSEQNFSYKNPSLLKISPESGSESGGTFVTFFGSDLDIGSNQTVTLSGQICDIKKRNSTHILCKSRPFLSGSKPSNTVKLTIDKLDLKPTGKNSQNKPYTFEYNKDPMNVDQSSTSISDNQLENPVKPTITTTVSSPGNNNVRSIKTNNPNESKPQNHPSTSGEISFSKGDSGSTNWYIVLGAVSGSALFVILVIVLIIKHRKESYKKLEKHRVPCRARKCHSGHNKRQSIGEEIKMIPIVHIN